MRTFSLSGRRFIPHGKTATKYYNPHRTHQGINGETPDISPRLPETSVSETNLVSESILGGLYHGYTKAA